MIEVERVDRGMGTTDRGRDTDSVEGCAGNSKARHLCDRGSYGRDPVEMAHRVLREPATPTRHRALGGRAIQAKELSHFPAGCRQQIGVAALQVPLLAHSPNRCAN